MTKITLKYTSKSMNSIITMEQSGTGRKVKITIKTYIAWESKPTTDTVWTDKDSANEFYTKRLKDGYARV